MTIGKKIYELRKNRGLTQEKLASFFNLTPQTISKWESDNSYPDITLLPQIASFFGITIDELFDFGKDKEYERIENMIDNKRFFARDEFILAENFLQKELDEDPKRYKALSMLADLYCTTAKQFNKKGMELAKRALAIEPYNRFDYCTLLQTWDGVILDWNVANHSEQIEYFKQFTIDHPNEERGFTALFDYLAADHRYEEAKQVVRQSKSLALRTNSRKFEGLYDYEEIYLVELRDGFQQAKPLYEELLQKYPNDWRVIFAVANSFAFNNLHAEARELYERSFVVEEKPRFVDALESIAQLSLHLGEKEKAIDAYEREIRLLKDEWDITFGETVDKVLRKIEEVK